MKCMTIITGASTGIGKALAEEFSRHGNDVLLIARSEDKLRKEKEKIQSIYHTHAEYIALDLMEEDAPKRVLRYVQENRISVDCLVNNAGIGNACIFQESEWSRDESIVKLNILALMHMNRLFLPIMCEQGHGTIVNIASTLAFAPTAGEAVYAASKAFVLSFSQALHEETKGTGVSVLTLCPGVTATEFFDSAGFELGKFKAATPESFAAFAYKMIAKKRALSIHRFSNRAAALFCRLAPRKFVREVFAAACNVQK